MALPYQELYYASTQQSLLTGADGFGIRTYSQGLPKELVERLKARNVFLYEAGAKALAGIFELLQTPAMVENYPKTFCFFQEEVQGKRFFVFTRTAFIGRDYGWYLKERDESARSGNLFCHAIFVLEADFNANSAASIFRALLTQFKPRDVNNRPENRELQSLLTNGSGPPSLLPTNHCTGCTQSLPPDPTERIEESLIALYTALESDRKIILVQSSDHTEKHLIRLLSCLPKFVIKSISFVSNYHQFNLFTDYTILFLNEYFQREIPSDHPYLIVCNYRTKEFPTLPTSDFFDHLRSLARSGNTDDLQRLIQGMDHILQDFREGVVFNQVFYAWLHLLETRPHNYHYNALEVIRNIKDYPLQPEFRNRLEKHIIESFIKALDARQHQKIATSLDLLVDLNLPAPRWKLVRTHFSDYFFEGDNAAGLYRYCQDKSLIIDTLDLDEQKEGLINFISQSTLPDEALYFFIEKFCEALPPEEVESMLYMAAIEEKIKPDITTKLKRSWGSERYFHFLTQQDFFIHMGEKLQPEFFGEDTSVYLQSMVFDDHDAFEYLRSKIASAPFFHEYFDQLVALADDALVSFEFNIGLLDFYCELIEQNLRPIGQLEPFHTILIAILKKFKWEDHHHLAPVLLDRSTKMKKALSNGEKKQSESAISKVQNNIQSCKDLLTFVFNVIKLREDTQDFINILIPTTEKKAIKEFSIHFMLAVLPIKAWLADDSAEHLFLNFYTKGDIKRMRYSLGENNLGLIEFIPLYYQHRITTTGHKGDMLINFHCTYIQLLWSLRKQKKGDSEDPTKITLYQVKEKTVVMLNALLELDKSACHAVLEFIYNEMPDSDTDLTKYIEENVQSRGVISSIFKKITSVFKKDKP